MAAVIRSIDARDRIRLPAPDFTTSPPPPSRRAPARQSSRPTRSSSSTAFPVAFIGLTLKGTPNLVSPPGVAGLEFRDEAETVNALVPELKARGVEAIVVLIHEGGFPTGDYNECPGISGPIVDIVKKFDKAVDVVVSGHTHQAYTCEIDGRLVTSGDKYGTIVTTIDLKLDPATRDVISAKADNVIVRTGVYAKDPEQTALLDAYDKFAGPIANRVAGSITASLSRLPNDAGESVLGDLIADAQLDATRADDNGGAAIAFTNPGGIRNDIVEEAGRRGDLCRRVRQPAVPQSAGDADADRRADQGHAGAAMARSRAPADSAGLEGIQLCLGQRQTVRPARDRRAHVAERPTHRSRGEPIASP